MLERKAIAWWFRAQAERSWWNYMHSKQHLSFGFLPPISCSNSSLLLQLTPWKEIPVMHHLMFLVCLCDPLHLVCPSPFSLVMGSLVCFSVKNHLPDRCSLCWFMEAAAADRPGNDMPACWQHRFQAKKALGWVLPNIHMGECAQRAFYSPVSHTV